MFQWSHYVPSSKIISVSFPYSSKNGNVITEIIVKINSRQKFSLQCYFLVSSHGQLALALREAKMAVLSQEWLRMPRDGKHPGSPLATGVNEEGRCSSFPLLCQHAGVWLLLLTLSFSCSLRWWKYPNC